MNNWIASARTEWRISIVFAALGVVTVWSVLTMAHAFAQEPSPAQADTAPSETKPAEAAPAKEVSPKDLLRDISGLAMQPVYMAVRVPVALVGALAGAVLWTASGGDMELAHKAWDPTLGEPWGWPDFVRGLGGSSRETP